MHTSCDPLRARTTGAQSLISKITAALAGPLLVAGFYVLIPGSSAVAATAVPPEVPGANWLSGHGVNVCYPIGTPCTGTTVFPAENPRGTTPYNWQCEELTARLWSTLNWYSGNWTQNAYELYGGLASSQVTNHPNDGSYVPVPGDLIVHAANDGFAEGAGHVAVVDSVDPGTLTIHAVEENVNPAYETSRGPGHLHQEWGTLDSPGNIGSSDRLCPRQCRLLHRLFSGCTSSCPGWFLRR